MKRKFPNPTQPSTPPNMENQNQPKSEATTATHNAKQLAQMWQRLSASEREGVKNARDIEAAQRLGITLWQFQNLSKGKSGKTIASK